MTDFQDKSYIQVDRKYLAFGGPHHRETSSSICRENQWTGFCDEPPSFMKELEHFQYDWGKFH